MFPRWAIAASENLPFSGVVPSAKEERVSLLGWATWDRQSPVALTGMFSGSLERTAATPVALRDSSATAAEAGNVGAGRSESWPGTQDRSPVGREEHPAAPAVWPGSPAGRSLFGVLFSGGPEGRVETGIDFLCVHATLATSRNRLGFWILRSRNERTRFRSRYLRHRPNQPRNPHGR